MRILHWYPDLLHGGGVANAVLGLAAAQAGQSAHVVIATATATERPLYEPIRQSSEVELLKWRPAGRLRLGRHSVRFLSQDERAKLRSLRPDVVHVHGEFNLDNLRVSRVFRSPVVISPHGACHPVVLAKSSRKAKRAYLAAERLLLSGHVTAFHALSPAEADDLAAVFPRARRYCVPQGPSVLVPQTSPRPAPLETARRRRVGFLYVGRLDVFTKGLDILLDAFAAAAYRPAAACMHLTLAGPDWNGGRRRLEHQAAELGIGERLHLTGPLAGSQIGALLAGADIYVQLSRHEGFPLSVVDALLAGKPAVLSSHIGLVSHPEIASLPHVRVVRPCRNVAASAMAEAADHVCQLTTAASASRDGLRHFFSWERVAEVHIQQYARLLHSSAHAGC